ncbi:MAG: hypothetical protein ACLRYM_06115 [Thomasclavelia ramosa]
MKIADIKNTINKYLDTKKKKIIASIAVIAVIISCIGGIVYFVENSSPALKLKEKKITIEYGETFNADFLTLIDTSGMKEKDKQYLKENVSIKSNIKNETETVTNDDGTVSEKDRGFAKVGNYEINIKYRKKTTKVSVTVKDTTAPEITAPEYIEILQGTDLATFDFKSLISATDLAQLNEIEIDYSAVDVNTPAEYTAKASVEDVNKNIAEKEIKVTVITPPALASDEEIVQETVTNADGSKTVKNTVKKKDNTDSTPSSNKPSSGNSGNGSSTDRPSSGGNTGGNTGGNNNPSGGGSTGDSGGSSTTDKPSSGGNTGGSTDGGSTTPPAHVHEWYATCKCGYHVTSSVSFEDAVNKLFVAGHGNVFGGHSSYEAGGCH